jgi:uncharacterized protein YcbK (DUF882 family)
MEKKTRIKTLHTLTGGRWRFLAGGTALLVVLFLFCAAALASPSSSAAPTPLPPNRSLSFYNTHTGESVSIEYCRSGCFVPRSLEKINYILRDDRTGETKEIDVRLLDLLFALSREIPTDEPFYIISGYRSPSTNRFLRTHSRGVSENSLHLLGKAIDIRVPGLRLRDLYKAAVALGGGGVGVYPRSDFIHIDVGRVRTW